MNNKQRFQNNDLDKVYWKWISLPQEKVDTLTSKKKCGANVDFAFKLGYNNKKGMFPKNSPIYAVYIAGKEYKKMNNNQ